MKYAYEQVQNAIDTYLQDNNLIGVKLNKAMQEEVLNQINEILLAKSATLKLQNPYQRLKSALKYSSYTRYKPSNASENCIIRRR